MKKTSRRPSIVLDAGYVSIKTYDRCKASKIIGLHGQRLCCVILTVFILFLVSSINLTFLIWIMSKLDLSPLTQNGSKVFRFDQINQQIEFNQQATFHEPIYTTKVYDSSAMNISSNRQMDIYGDYNSIFFDANQIAMNTEYFHFNGQSLVDFTNLDGLQFKSKKRTRIHLDQIQCPHIHSQYLNLWAEKNVTITDTNRILFSGQNLSITTMDRHDRQSEIYFRGNNERRKHSRKDHLNFQIATIYLDIPRVNSSENRHLDHSETFRLCICNTSFLLLRSFAHQPCPLC